MDVAPARMEHLALQTRLSLRQVCSVIRGALDLPEMEFGAENETEWASCRADDIEYNVSRPYRAKTLRTWDPSVPDGCNVGVTIIIDEQHPRVADAAWIIDSLVTDVGQRLAEALDCAVHHHRTWLAGRRDEPRAHTFTAER